MTPRSNPGAPGPGAKSMLIGMVGMIIYVAGMALASPDGTAANERSLIGLLVLAVSVVFVSAVIAAYHAGKRQR